MGDSSADTNKIQIIRNILKAYTSENWKIKEKLVDFLTHMTIKRT
jgi:hypothetical protein